MPRILLVDDDPECLLALSNRLRFAFRKHGLKVDTAECAVTGLILAHEDHYDALVVDVVMPGITGLKFVEQLRRTQPQVPIIMISGWDVNACAEQARRLDLMACLPKPIEFASLRDLLGQVLGEGDRPRERVHQFARQGRHKPRSTSARKPYPS